MGLLVDYTKQEQICELQRDQKLPRISKEWKTENSD